MDHFCDRCDSGFVLNGADCTPDVPCDKDVDNCQSCTAESLEGKKDKEDEWEGTKCEVCDKGFFLDDGKCESDKWVKHSNRQCTGYQGELLSGFTGNEAECKVKCTEIGCNGFVRKNGKCDFREGYLTIMRTDESQDCFENRDTCGSYECMTPGWTKKQSSGDLTSPSEVRCCEPKCEWYRCQTDGWVKRADSDNWRGMTDAVCCNPQFAVLSSGRCSTYGDGYFPINSLNGCKDAVNWLDLFDGAATVDETSGTGKPEGCYKTGSDVFLASNIGNVGNGVIGGRLQVCQSKNPVSCDSSIQDCVSCTEKAGFECEICDHDHVLENGECRNVRSCDASVENCASCTSNSGWACEACELGFFLVRGVCSPLATCGNFDCSSESKNTVSKSADSPCPGTHTGNGGLIISTCDASVCCLPQESCKVFDCSKQSNTINKGNYGTLCTGNWGTCDLSTCCKAPSTCAGSVKNCASCTTNGGTVCELCTNNYLLINGVCNAPFKWASTGGGCEDYTAYHSPANPSDCNAAAKWLSLADDTSEIETDYQRPEGCQMDDKGQDLIWNSNYVSNEGNGNRGGHTQVCALKTQYRWVWNARACSGGTKVLSSDKISAEVCAGLTKSDAACGTEFQIDTFSGNQQTCRCLRTGEACSPYFSSASTRYEVEDPACTDDNSFWYGRYDDCDEFIKGGYCTGTDKWSRIHNPERNKANKENQLSGAIPFCQRSCGNCKAVLE